MIIRQDVTKERLSQMACIQHNLDIYNTNFHLFEFSFLPTGMIIPLPQKIGIGNHELKNLNLLQC